MCLHENTIINLTALVLTTFVISICMRLGLVRPKSLNQHFKYIYMYSWTKYSNNFKNIEIATKLPEEWLLVHHQQLDAATTQRHMTRHCTVLSRSNAKPHYTLKSMRMCTLTTLGLCCLLRCTIIKDRRRTYIACLRLWGTVIKDQRIIDVKARGFQYTHNREEPMNNEKAKNAKREGEKLRCWEYENHKVQKYLWNWFGRFTKELKVKVHYREIEVCHMWSRFRRIMNQFRRCMKFIEYPDSIGWKVHELRVAFNLLEIEFAFMWSHLTKIVILSSSPQLFHVSVK